MWSEWVSQLEEWASHAPDTTRSLPHHPLCPVGKSTAATLHHLDELCFLTPLGVQGTLTVPLGWKLSWCLLEAGVFLCVEWTLHRLGPCEWVGLGTDIYQLRQGHLWRVERKCSHKERATGEAILGTNHLRDSMAKGLGVACIEKWFRCCPWLRLPPLVSELLGH